MIKATGQLKHKLLSEDLRRLLVKRSPGEAFLSVREIMDQFDVSQATVTKALETLCEEGLLERNVGQGTFVTEEVLRHKKGSPPVICLAVARWESGYLLQLQNIFSSLASELGFYPEILQFDWREVVPEKLPPRKTDALLVAPSGGKMELKHIERLANYSKHCAVYGHELKELPIDSVFSDENYAGVLAASHLIKLGHRKLAVAMTEPENGITLPRMEGFRSHAALHELQTTLIDCHMKHGDDGLPIIYNKLKGLLKEGAFDATGLFVISSSASLAAIKALHEASLRIPADLSVLSCSGDSLTKYYHPALTVINEPVEDMLRGIVRSLMDRIAGKGVAGGAKLAYKPALFQRESTGPAPLQTRNKA
jgi:DNA-binding LacI/PurR family transcriptional regulator